LLSGLSPAQITTAYGMNDVTFSTANGSVVKGDGSGETIALIEAYHDPTLASDLNVFDQAYGLPTPSLTVDNLAGGLTNDGWGLEESLDVEWSHAVAPGANLLVVEASSQTLPALIAAVNIARDTPGVVSVSMSWGFSEFARETQYNGTFTTPSGHQGITFLAASGDSGAAGGPEWPSVAPTVVGVGGTSLYIDSFGQYEFEDAWIGSSGGYSRFEPEPNYQRSVQKTGRRSSPDVSFDGDPNSGVSVYQTSHLTGQGAWYTVGGTSLGTPVWAAIFAIVDQGRAIDGEGSLDGATQALPTLYTLSANDFNAVARLVRAKASATATANTETGRGSPDGPYLIPGLVNSTIAVPLATSFSEARVAARASRARARKAELMAREPLARLALRLVYSRHPLSDRKSL
jgi:subtilase family serine protease